MQMVRHAVNEIASLSFVISFHFPVCTKAPSHLQRNAYHLQDEEIMAYKIVAQCSITGQKVRAGKEAQVLTGRRLFIVGNNWQPPL